MTTQMEADIQVRHNIGPGDLGRIVELHGRLYAGEYGFDHRFEAYVARTLGEFAGEELVPPGRLWLAECGDQLVGSVGAVLRDPGQVQLRWLLVSPEARGRGLGRQLVRLVVDYAHDQGCQSVYLWTVSPLVDAARLYQACGFRLTDETAEQPLWGVRLREQCYEITVDHRT